MCEWCVWGKGVKNAGGKEGEEERESHPTGNVTPEVVLAAVYTCSGSGNA